MIRLDSIKILAPIQALNDVDFSAFNHTQKSQKGIKTSDVYSADNLNFGVNRIAIDNKANNVTLEVSAKALKNDYSEGININTFEQLIDSINTTKIVKLDAGVIYNAGELLKCDVTDNVKVDYSGQNFYSDIAAIPLPNKYEITSYNRRTNKGVVFAGKQKSFKERLILYDKIIELHSNRKGKDFLNSIDKAKVFKDFKNTVRTETNFTQLRKIREYLGSNKIQDVLSSDAKVNYKVFDKITKQANTEVLHLFDQYEGMTLKEIINRKGIERIITDAAFNWQFIDLFLLKKVGTDNHRRERQKFRKIYNELQAGTTFQNNTTIITMFLDALSKVA
jgi:hypothetical protein